MKKTNKFIALILALTLCLGLCSTAMAAEADLSEKHADALNSLGLFRGTDLGYELDRTPTRLEALIMFIRLTGHEREALYPLETESRESPYTDLPTWDGAANYIGYAYAEGLTSGTTDTTFHPNSPATAQMFVAFVLRALGYDKDESWSNWEALAKDAGLFADGVDTADFTRGDAVLISFAALSAKMKSEDITLGTHLIDLGVFSDLMYNIVRVELGHKVTINSTIPEIYGALYAGVEAANPARYWVNPFDAAMAPYFIGAEGLDMVEGYACEPMMTSVAHSVCLVRLAEGSDIEAAKSEILAKANPRKWLCVGVDPENVFVANVGNLVVLVMDNKCGRQIVDNFLALAQ